MSHCRISFMNGEIENSPHGFIAADVSSHFLLMDFVMITISTGRLKESHVGTLVYIFTSVLD